MCISRTGGSLLADTQARRTIKMYVEGPTTAILLRRRLLLHLLIEK